MGTDLLRDSTSDYPEEHQLVIRVLMHLPSGHAASTVSYVLPTGREMQWPHG